MEKCKTKQKGKKGQFNDNLIFFVQVTQYQYLVQYSIYIINKNRLLPEYSMYTQNPSSEQSRSLDQIQQHLKQNQINMQTMQNFLQSKRLQVTQLQNYLIKQFQDLQKWKQNKQKIMQSMKKQGQKTKVLFFDLRNMLNGLIKDIIKIGEVLTKQAITLSIQKLYQKDKIINDKNRQIMQLSRQLQQKNNKIQQQLQLITKLKQQTKNNVISKPLFPHLRQLSKQISQRQFQNHNNNINSQKNMSKSTFLENHMNVMKSKEKQKQRDKEKLRIQWSRSPANKYDKEDPKNSQKMVKTFKNFYEQQNKLSKSPTAKRIMYEVHKNLKQDYENNNQTQMQHKKYVKQKIQCLKNKNSGIFNNEVRPFKAERRF